MKNKQSHIVCINGSGRANGETYLVIQNLLTQLQNKTTNEFIIEDISFYIRNLKMCKGCLNCFHFGECHIDDDISIVKKKLIEADLIIIGTPVYMGTVTGVMKNLLDRLASWCHLLSLLGKRCILVVVTQNSGLDDTLEYMYKVVNYFGLDVIGVIGIRKNKLDTYLNLQIDIVVNRYNRITKYSERIFPNFYKNGIFENLKTVYMMQYKMGVKSHEVEYWEKKGYFEKNLDQILKQVDNE